MSISDIFSSGKHKQNLGHFASIVKIAIADGKIEVGEERLLIDSAKRLNISLDEFKAIIANPEKYPINAPVSYDERIERLYQLTLMLFADNETELKEVLLLRKIAIALNFSLDNAEKICDEAIHLIMNTNDLEDFTNAIKNVNSN